MKTVKVGINGGGRIGRMFLRSVLRSIRSGDRSVDIVAINDIGIKPDYMAYLIKFDSTHQTLDVDVTYQGDMIDVGGFIKFKLISEMDPKKLGWGALGVDYVLESTGIFTTVEKASSHLTAGAKRVIISAPSEDAPMFVVGVNHDKYDPSKMNVVSNASCTTNCLAPLVKVIYDNFGFETGLMTTIHATTATQKTVDGPSAKDWRAGRAASVNLIPASTGAAKAVGKVFPAVNGRLTGMAFRVPVINVSCVDLTCTVEKAATKADVDKAIQTAAASTMKGIIKFADFEAVSTDFNGSSESCVYDSKAFCSIDKDKPQKCLKLIAWYDNEMGYSSRLVDLIRHMASRE